MTFLYLALVQSASIQNPKDIKLGVLLGFTGPVASLVPPLHSAIKLAVQEVNASGALLGGVQVGLLTGDTGCTDGPLALASAERLVSQGVKAFVGSACSPVTTEVLQNVAKPRGIMMVSPAASSSAISDIEDHGLFFRLSPTDYRQAEVMAKIILEKGINKVAVTYINNNYGKAMSDFFEKEFTASGGQITVLGQYGDNQADYSSEVAVLGAAGGDLLVVIGYLDQGGKAIVQESLDSGAFDLFFLPSGMTGDKLLDGLGSQLDGSFGFYPASNGPGRLQFFEIAKKNGFQTNSPYAGEAYDSTAIILLAMQAAKSSNSSKAKEKVMEVANPPGEKIYPGELGKALRILSQGGDIDYVGASNVELLDDGDPKGSYREIEIKNGKIKTVRFR